MYLSINIIPNPSCLWGSARTAGRAAAWQSWEVISSCVVKVCVGVWVSGWEAGGGWRGSECASVERCMCVVG